MRVAHLSVEGIQVSYGARPVLNRIDLVVPRGQLLGILGPNGSGKSTLLKVIGKTLKPRLGRVILQERDLTRLAAREVAREMAVVGQENPMDFPFTVREVVSMGRFPHLGRFQKEGPGDKSRVDQSLFLTRTGHLAERRITELSGGEKQRAVIARALAQEPRVLLLDEPTSHLDINHQVEILEIVRRLNRDQEVTVIMALHDLNLASEYCDQLLLLQAGQIFAAGTPDEVITRENVAQVYGNQVLVRPHPLNQRPQVLLLPSAGVKDNPAAAKWRVHVVAGGGAGSGLFHCLVARGFAVTTGVLNVGDSDWEQARILGLPMAQVPPFCPVDPEAHQENLRLMSQAHRLVLAPIPLGWGNVCNLEAVLQQASRGATVLVVDPEGFPQRDHSEGQAAYLLEQLLALPAVARVKTAAEAVERLGKEVEIHAG